MYEHQDDKMIEALNLCKNYGNNIGIENLNFKVEKGEIVGLLGVNGAGKTTTLNILAGFNPPDDGVVSINGTDISLNPLEAKKNIGYLPEIPPLYPELSVTSYLEFVYKIKNGKKEKIQDSLKDIMGLVNIDHVKNRIIKNLSKGYKQRIGIAQALISKPDIIILDEPTVGLDPRQIIEVRNLIKSLSKNHTVIISSHILAEVNQICDKVIILNKGKIVAIDSPENLSKNSSAFDRFFVRIKGNKDEVIKRIGSINGIKNIKLNNENEFLGTFSYTIDCDKNIDVIEPLFYLMAENKFVIYELKSMNYDLEEIFIQLTNEAF
jgi:ABC-2 type transport system ATP-binding protein